MHGGSRCACPHCACGEDRGDAGPPDACGPLSNGDIEEGVQACEGGDVKAAAEERREGRVVGSVEERCWDVRRARVGVAVQDLGDLAPCCSAAEERRGAVRTSQRRTWGREVIAEADMGRCTTEAQQRGRLDGSALTCQACGNAKPVAVGWKTGRWCDTVWGGGDVVEAVGTLWRRWGRGGSGDVVEAAGMSWRQRGCRGGSGDVVEAAGTLWRSDVVGVVVGVAGDAEGGANVGGFVGQECGGGDTEGSGRDAEGGVQGGGGRCCCRRGRRGQRAGQCRRWGARHGTRVAAANVVVVAGDAEGGADVGARGEMPMTRCLCGGAHRGTRLGQRMSWVLPVIQTAARTWGGSSWLLNKSAGEYEGQGRRRMQTLEGGVLGGPAKVECAVVVELTAGNVMHCLHCQTDRPNDRCGLQARGQCWAWAAEHLHRKQECGRHIVRGAQWQLYGESHGVLKCGRRNVPRVKTLTVEHEHENMTSGEPE
ncbi:hypothetical protein B0H17DRAFT_1139240 [Mycena rosella]|uniref:Uncharacterized protein n=1 Tax=Mycena rosella TaxID=1033263 RepID=A0AAD7D4K4_MYCRO|nr:hypothetical protein B0H17DRAFT_1139240 [Mycena rosella]